MTHGSESSVGKTHTDPSHPWEKTHTDPSSAFFITGTHRHGSGSPAGALVGCLSNNTERVLSMAYRGGGADRRATHQQHIPGLLCGARHSCGEDPKGLVSKWSRRMVNRTIIKGMQTQLIEGGLDHRFWAESATVYCYVHGLIPSTCHPDIIPWVAWFRRKDADGNLVKLNVLHLRAWGSVCWVKDLDGVAGKLGVQGWKGKMVDIWGGMDIAFYPMRDIVFEECVPHCTRVKVNEDPLPEDLTLFDDPPAQPNDALAPDAAVLEGAAPDNAATAPNIMLPAVQPPAPAPVIINPPPPQQSHRF
ncbi:hypothetical protein C8R44DRAFT_731640 [Mycena epipterygia]|nr:hypothetical protein C8R44DRAFT_731640 [Mycena epipterygia]